MNERAQRDLDRRMLDMAARLASRARGDVEPNPLVGCVIGRVRGAEVEILGAGHHRRFGAAHAEVEALRDCRNREHDPAGATAWVTLEPCAHQGKTSPCADALIEAGLGEVVIARRDPHEDAKGGAEKLREAGINARFTDASNNAIHVSDPFVHRIRTGRPWVIAKWAQSIDGRIATRTGESKWISNERSRLDVHRLRSRVDAILTGIGTALVDDPSLTARRVRRVRRTAIRIVVDPRLDLPTESALAQSARDVPVEVWCAEPVGTMEVRRAALESCGVKVAPAPMIDGRIDLRKCLARLVAERDATNVLVEAGGGLLGSLLDVDLIDEARVYIAPMALADEAALPALRGQRARTIADAVSFELAEARRFGDDVRLRYRRRRSPEG